MTGEEKTILVRLEEKVDSLTISNDRIISVLAGDELQGKGLIKKVDKLERDMQLKNNESWVVRSLFAIGVFLITFWKAIISLFRQ